MPCASASPADAGETAGADRYRHQIEIAGHQPSLGQHRFRHAGQVRGVAAPDLFLPSGEQRPIHHHGRGALRQRRIESENPNHRPTLTARRPGG